MLKIGLIGFGGGSALIPLFEDEFVRKTPNLTHDQFTRKTIIASITPGALPVKLAGLIGAKLHGSWSALLASMAVAVPGTLGTVALLSMVQSGGSVLVRAVEAASIGIAAFIIALLVHYIHSVIAQSAQRWQAIFIILSVLVIGSAADTVRLFGQMFGQTWQVPIPSLNTVQTIFLALLIILVTSAVQSKRLGNPNLKKQVPTTRTPGFRKPIIGLLGLTVFGGVLTTLLVGLEGLKVMGLVLMSTLTSFGGGEAYVAVADGFFVSGNYVEGNLFYTQVVPIANAMPGPILVKIAAAIGYLVGGQGPIGWGVALAAASVAIGSCTALALLLLGLYQRVEGSHVVAGISNNILPVISGLLVQVAVTMLQTSTEVAETASKSGPLVIWVSLIGVLVIWKIRGLKRVPDLWLVLLTATISVVGLMLL